MTFQTLQRALADDFVAVSENALEEACLTLIRTTHNLVEGAGAAGLAGLLAIAATGRLDGRSVGIVISGANIDMATLSSILARTKSR